MHIIEKNLRKAEKRYANEKTGANALALFADYVLAGRTIAKDSAYLSKAFHVAVTSHQEDLLDLKIISAVLYANVLLENYETAYELIKALDSHSSFLSKNMPLYYGQILYFYSIVQFKVDKVRSAKKIHRNLELLYEKTGLAQLLTYLASLKRIVFADMERCAAMYGEAVSKGCDGVFMYLEIYEILMNEEEYSKDLNELTRKVIPWALNKDLPIGNILDRLEKRTLISILFSLSTQHLSKIFMTYELWSAFQCLCQKLISGGDTSDTALSCYKLALKNGLALRGLSHMTVKAAYTNNYYDIPLPVVKAALEQPAEYNTDQLAFLSSILVSQKENNEALDEHKESVVKFGLWAHSKGYRGKNYNAVYKFLFELHPDDGRFLETLTEELFKYEVNFSGKPPRYVCVCEYARKGMTRYEVVKGKCRISSLGDPELYFLGDNDGEYLCVKDYTVTKALDTMDSTLIETFYEKGNESQELIMSLAMEYLTHRSLDKKKLDVLQRVTGLTDISRNFRIDVCAALAYHYAKERQYSLAIHYYTYLGENNIKPHCLEGALNTYVATGRYDSALSLITKKHYAISDTAIFNALTVLYEKADTLEIASVCYNLILNDLCSSEILNIVMRKFKGTMAEWLKLTNKIDSLGFDVSQLYEKIIINGIFIGSINDDCNEAFIKLYKKNKGHPIILKYAYFCCYEAIRNDKPIPESLAEALEDLYVAGGEDRLLCYALAITYIKNGRQDKAALMGAAAAYLEEDGIILHKFKEYQNKSFISSYIEKNTPFVYYQAPYRNISICYKSGDAAAYTKKPLKYFKFGIYLVSLPLFYGEKISYYFEEENGARTEPKMFVNNHMRIVEQFTDSFYTVNNLIIYEHMMKFDLAEELMESEFSKNQQFDVLIL